MLSEVDDRGALDLVVEDLVGSDSGASALPGVLGPKEHAVTFAERWSARTGRAYRLDTSERIFRLTRVRPPRPVLGRLRTAEPRDRDLLVDWGAAFHREALHDDDVSNMPMIVDRWIAAQGRTMYLWDDAGPVSMVRVGGPDSNGIRVGPVYTPPELRGRGYASACVAAVSQAQLDTGRSFCFLFTDLANPTSNHIYQEIGYEPVRDVDVYRFGDD